MICPKCNNSSPDNARFCEHCGAALLNGQQVVRGRGTHQQDWNETRQGWETSWSEPEARPAEVPSRVPKKKTDRLLGFRLFLWGCVLSFWGLLFLGILLDSPDLGAVVALLIVGIPSVWRFVVLLRRYRSPENREKRRIAEEKSRQEYEKWRAEAPERKRQREIMKEYKRQ